MAKFKINPEQVTWDARALEEGARDIAALNGMSGLRVRVIPGNGSMCMPAPDGTIMVVIDPLQAKYGHKGMRASTEGEGSEPDPSAPPSEATALFITGHEIGHARDMMDPAYVRVNHEGITRSRKMFNMLMDDTVIDRRQRNIPRLDAIADEVYLHSMPTDLRNDPKHLQLIDGLRVSTVVPSAELQLDPAVAEIIDHLHHYQRGDVTYNVMEVLADPATSYTERHQLAEEIILPYYEQLLAEDKEAKRRRGDQQAQDGEQEPDDDSDSDSGKGKGNKKSKDGKRSDESGDDSDTDQEDDKPSDSKDKGDGNGDKPGSKDGEKKEGQQDGEDTADSNSDEKKDGSKNGKSDTDSEDKADDTEKGDPDSDSGSGDGEGGAKPGDQSDPNADSDQSQGGDSGNQSGEQDGEQGEGNAKPGDQSDPSSSGGGEGESDEEPSFDDDYDDYEDRTHGYKNHDRKSSGNGAGNNPEADEDMLEREDLAEKLAELLKQIEDTTEIPDELLEELERLALPAELAGKIAAELHLEMQMAEDYAQALHDLRDVINQVAKVFLRLAAPAEAGTRPVYGRRSRMEGDRLHNGRMASVAIQMATGQSLPIYQRPVREAARQETIFGGLDVWLLVDVSGSMSEDGKAKCAADTALCLTEGLQLARQHAARQAGSTKLPDVRTQITAFGSGYVDISPLSYEPTPLQKGATYTALRLPNSNNTRVSGALAAARQSALSNPTRQTIVIIVSDGSFGDQSYAQDVVYGKPSTMHIAQLVIGYDSVSYITPDAQRVTRPADLPSRLLGTLERIIRTMATAGE